MGADPARHTAGNALDTRIYTNHFNSNCRFRGTARLAGRTFEVDAAGWRDHSWGPRKWNAFPVNRVVVANFGEDLAVSALAQVWTDGSITKRGQLTRDGVRRAFTDFESLVLMEDDGISARSAEFTAILDTDEQVTFRVDLVGGVIYKNRNSALASMESAIATWATASGSASWSSTPILASASSCRSTPCTAA